MADDWDADDFVPKVPVIPKAVKDAWDDEEDGDVKESWEEINIPAKTSEVKEKKPKAKAVAPVVTEEKSIKDFKDMTEEERKLAQEEADLKHTQSLFGVDKSLDDLSLNTKEDFHDYSNRLYAKLNKFHSNSNYYDFVEEIMKSLCKNMPADSIRKLSNSFKAFSDAKTAEEKLLKQKDQKPKGKAKGKIKIEKDVIKGDFDVFLKDKAGGLDEDEDEDFM